MHAPVLTGLELAAFYGRAGVVRKATIALRGLARRAASLLPIGARPDVVLVQREAFFLFNEWSERLASLRAPIVFDFDDAIWIHAVSEANRRFGFLKNVSKIPRIARLAHTVIAGNEYLATWARQHNPRVHVVPTCVDTERWTDAPRTDTGIVTIGWSGSASTLAHLELILPALREVHRRFGNRVRVRVMGAPSFRDAALGVAGEPWSEPAEIPFLQSMDIGLMPLPNDEWSKGKCGLKGLTSMACGAATVMSPVGVNPSIIEHGVNGFLASTHDEWVARLSELIEDAELRRHLGAAGRRTVVERYSIARWAPVLIELLEKAAASRR